MWYFLLLFSFFFVITIQNSSTPFALVIRGVSIACNGVSTRKVSIPNVRELTKSNLLDRVAQVGSGKVGIQSEHALDSVYLGSTDRLVRFQINQDAPSF